MYRVFKNDGQESIITQKGYVVIDNLVPETVCDDLRQFYDAQTFIDDRAFTISNWNSDLAHREAVYNRICESLQPFAKQILNDYKPVLGVFTAKQPKAGSDMLIHQDWSLVDEKKYRSVSIWVALCDMDRTNGNLQVAEFSHIYAGRPRGMNMQVPFENLRKEIGARHLTDVPMRKGDVIVFDHRLIHASPENNSKELRLAAVLALIPAEAELIHYYKYPDNDLQLELLKMREEDFRQIDFFDGPGKPKHTGIFGHVAFNAEQITLEELLQGEEEGRQAKILNHSI